MTSKEAFIAQITQGYQAKGKTILLGAGILDKKCMPQTRITIPVKTLNRHGLIAGATGTGKTKTLQLLAEALSENGIPVLLMDIKGDLNGIGKPGQENAAVKERQEKLKIPYIPQKYPLEFISLSGDRAVHLRATVSEFGPILLSRILDLNDTQSGVIAVLFKYCDDQELPLLDLKDLKQTLQYMIQEGKEEIEGVYGHISSTTVGAILRRIVELEQQGANRFFGEKSFEVDDLLRVDERGYGVISLVRLTDMQDKPKLFSTFMLSLLAEVYASFPEVGDRELPKLVIFFDEAHLLFDEASKVLLKQLQTIIKLIRSKGVGLFFCTQSPTDLPDAILSQLGLKIQHALRAFTAKDRKAMKQAAENFPVTAFYQVDQELMQLGIGEAFVTALNEKGTPTPLVHTLLLAPQSQMGALSEEEVEQIVAASHLTAKYNREIDTKSAYEILTDKIRKAKEEEKKPEREFSVYDIMSSTFGKEVSRTIAKEVSRAILGVLGLGGKR